MEDKFLLGGFGSKITFHSFLGNVWFVISSFHVVHLPGWYKLPEGAGNCPSTLGQIVNLGWRIPNIQKQHVLGKLRKFDDWKKIQNIFSQNSGVSWWYTMIETVKNHQLYKQLQDDDLPIYAPRYMGCIFASPAKLPKTQHLVIPIPTRLEVAMTQINRTNRRCRARCRSGMADWRIIRCSESKAFRVWIKVKPKNSWCFWWYLMMYYGQKIPFLKPGFSDQ